MKTAIVYHSAGGNTKALAEAIYSFLPEAKLFRVKDFDLSTISQYEGLLVGTYTWGDGDLPAKIIPLYEELEIAQVSQLVTGVFGTGETNYNHFCGAVNRFRDMLFANTQLAVTLKIEQMYQESDLSRIKKFTEIYKEKLRVQQNKLVK
ncbi:flavodoxin domain-containing protein [Peribacillus huizhouensis]|uniref:Flavodoxin I n=1 Tax=Peribacillus huizhouensis TaxID=1501239 RepID=A0ABR6CKW5_9BACI|nr:flavodoxin domain-containing protein [Peribacillus huizhouensis]MBA9025356.1 flavodoxin I [Peribacillus huizhouensis]